MRCFVHKIINSNKSVLLTSCFSKYAPIDKLIYSQQQQQQQTTAVSQTVVDNYVSDKQLVYQSVKLIGWIQSIRRHKSRVFFNISDGTTPSDLQVVMNPSDVSDQMTIGSAVSVEGKLYPSISPISLSSSAMSSLKAKLINTKQCAVELHAENVVVYKNSQQLPVNNNSITMNTALNTESSSSVPSLGKHSPRPDLGLLRSSYALASRHRLPEFGAMIRMRALIKQLFRDVMHSFEYLETDTPVLTTVDCENTGEVFKIFKSNDNPKNQTDAVFLTGSAQLHLEALALGLSKVYSFGPVFRAESSHTRHHLAEFHMLEVESVNLHNVTDLCDEIEKIIKMLLGYCLDLYLPNIDTNRLDRISDNQRNLLLIRSLLSSQPASGEETGLDFDHVNNFANHLACIIKKPFTRLSYHDAKDYLRQEHNFPLDETRNFTKVEENCITQWMGQNSPVFITHFPAELKAFYCACSNDESRVECADLLFPGVGELVGGSVRETDAQRLRTKFNSVESSLNSLNWYVDLCKAGCVPHAGFGLGFERFLQYVLGVNNIRDTIPFPRICDKIAL